MQRAHFLLPEEIKAIVAPAAGNLDNQFLFAGSVMRPIVGDDDLFDEIDRVAGSGVGSRHMETEVIAPSSGGSTDHRQDLRHRITGLHQRRRDDRRSPTSSAATLPNQRTVARPDITMRSLPRDRGRRRLRGAAGRRLRAPARPAALQQSSCSVARFGGHRLDRLELLAADQVHAGQHPLELFA